MDPIILENYLHENIPLTLAMGIRVVELSPKQVILAAPIRPNINHKKTVFGGSLHSLATVACWSFVYYHLFDEKEKYEIVITQSEIKYIEPVTSDFIAVCRLDDPDSLEHFKKTLDKKGKARLRLQASIHHETKPAVEYSGDFVALKTPRDEK